MSVSISAVAGMLALAGIAIAQTPPAPPGNPLLAPGKIDLNLRATDGEDIYNLMWWTPFAKFGIRHLEPENGSDAQSIGGFIRPLLPARATSDLIAGGQMLRIAGRTDYELQAEYRIPSGFGFGGGIVRRETNNPDISFAKVTYRNKRANWNYILEAQAQKVADETSRGGYGALYNPLAMVVYGNDGEQWRGTFGFIAPDRKQRFRPAFEALYIDNDIGDFRGAKTLSVVATGRFTGGFLSHPARLGRAMGPQGLEFANPVAFLAPTWNRRLDPWEFGGMFNFGLLRNELPNGTRTQRAEALVFPFQIAGTDSFLTPLFVGALRVHNNGRNANGWMAGFVKPIGRFQIAAQVEDDTVAKPRVTVGVIRWF
jgi:hypothetical protein